MKSKEAKLCQDAGVEFQEFIVGNDGVAVSNSLAGQKFSISIAHVAAALAAELPNQSSSNEAAKANGLNTWAEVDAYVAKATGTTAIGLLAQKVKIMVPPPTSGTRDAIGSLFMKARWKN